MSLSKNRRHAKKESTTPPLDQNNHYEEVKIEDELMLKYKKSWNFFIDLILATYVGA